MQASLRAAREIGDAKRENDVLKDLELVKELRSRLEADPQLAVPNLRVLRTQKALADSQAAPHSGEPQPAQITAPILSSGGKQTTEPLAPGATPHVTPSSAPNLTLDPTPVRSAPQSPRTSKDNKDDWLALTLATPGHAL